MGLGVGPWKTVQIDISDSDVLSDECDLGGEFQDLLVIIPTITSSTIGVNVAKESGGTFYPLHILDDDATGSFLSATTAAVTSLAIIFHVGAARFIKITAGSAQAADRDFLVRGINPV
jgi:hypothetical protein